MAEDLNDLSDLQLQQANLLNQKQQAQKLGLAAQTVGGITDALGGNQQNTQLNSMNAQAGLGTGSGQGTSTMSGAMGALGGAAQGAMGGMALGPAGMAVGGLLGGLSGLFK
jgi:hypothetical protein